MKIAVDSVQFAMMHSERQGKQKTEIISNKMKPREMNANAQTIVLCGKSLADKGEQS